MGRSERVENRHPESRDAPGCRFTSFEHDDLVASPLEPGTGEEERLLRTDVPVATEVDAVHEHDPLVPGAHVEEGVAGALERKRTAEPPRDPARRGARSADGRWLVEWQLIH